jgi:NAD(P)-dependent dehydrogenase (short-subunit alcohol dehydrogenase family)
MNDKLNALIHELASHETHVLVKACDVSSRADVERLVNEELTHLPPVRGVVHGAMVLRVSSLTIISLFQAAARLIGYV